MNELSNGTANGHGAKPYVKPSTRLRRLLAQDGCVQAPGVYDGISARLAIEAGFQVMYQSGAMTTASRLGLPDIAFASLNDFADNGRMIANLDQSVPLIADADTGFGGPNAIARMVTSYDRAGIAGFHIEDQIQMKRCGHLKGKQLVDIETWRTRVRAAVQARAVVPGGSDIVIIARTDALAVDGFDEAINRLLAAKECGADVAFLEAVSSKDEVVKAIELLSPMPCLVNLVPNGRTPCWTMKELASWGVKLAIYPVVAGNPALHAIRASFQTLKETGKDDTQAGGYSPRDFFDVMGLKHEEEIDRLAGGQAFALGA